MVIGDGINFVVQDNKTQDKINNIYKNNLLDILIFQSAITQSKSGYTVIRVRNEDDKAIIEEIPVDMYFPKYSGNISEKLEEVVLASFVNIIDDRGHKIKCVYKQKYFYNDDEDVLLKHELWSVNSQNICVEQKPISFFDVNLSDEPENIGLLTIPVWQINNLKITNQIGRAHV